MRKLFALLLCLSLTLGGLTLPAAAEGETTYRMLIDAEVPTLNYLLSSTAIEFRIHANVLDTLIEFDRFGQVQPALAKSWDVSEDGMTYTFHLREDAYWVTSNGEQYDTIKAQDFVTSAKYILNGANAAPTNWILTDIIEGAEAYLDGTTPPEEGEEPAPATDFSTVGVKAIDEYTIQYKLIAAAPYFLNMLDYVCFIPVSEKFMNEMGDQFGIASSSDSILYCGAYYLSTFKPQEKQIFTKNPHYWDKDNVFIDILDKTFNKEATTIAPELFQRGEIDEIRDLSSTVAEQWLSNPETANLLRPRKQLGQYTYFYNFNFDPQFGEEYEPDNWRKFVNNENFRQSFFFGLDRVKAMSVFEKDNPESLLYKTFTPPNIIAYSGTDYTMTGALKPISEAEPFDPERAVFYRDKAIEELTAEGATFPVKIPMYYNPTTVSWDQECQVVEQQLEALLGTDYIDIIVLAGPATGFLQSIRRSGQYAFMKCNWGLDYPDPLNTNEPWQVGNSYNFLDKVHGDFPYYDLIKEAKPIFDNMGKRYEAFAEAEAYLIDHAVSIPYGTDEGGYMADRVNPFERQHNACGLANERYKGQHLLDKPMSIDDFYNEMDAWEAARLSTIGA